MAAQYEASTELLEGHTTLDHLARGFLIAMMAPVAMLLVPFGYLLGAHRRSGRRRKGEVALLPGEELVEVEVVDESVRS